MNSTLPTNAELAILGVLWGQGPATVRQVHDALQDARGRPSAYTTTLKLLQIMLAKHLVSRDESSRTHVYRAALDRQEVEGRLVGDLADRLFGGSTGRLALRALDERPASHDELRDMRRLLDRLEGKATFD